MPKVNLCIDFDGVIHSYTTKWTSSEIIPDPPIEGSFDFILAAMKHFKVAIFSTRILHGGERAIKNWMIKHGFPQNLLDFLIFTANKIPAIAYIDDRAFPFHGKFPDIEELKNFTPWHSNDDHGVRTEKTKFKLSPGQRLERIAEIIELVDQRAAAADGPVTPTKDEITTQELIQIYRLAKQK